MTGFVLDPDDLIVLADDVAEPDFEDLLADTASGVELRTPDYDPDDEDGPDDEDAEIDAYEAALAEASVTAWVKAKFDEKQHPRWPKGSGEKAGQFMQVGQRFVKDGKPYEITAFQGGKVYAHLATGAPEPKTIALKPKAVGEHQELEVAPATEKKDVVVSGGKSNSGKTIKGQIVIDPFVDSASHDPSIKPPESFKIGDEQWKRFGREDQERIHALEERFGSWSKGKSKTLIDEIAAQYDYEAKGVVHDALTNQYGSSSGSTLSLSEIFDGLSDYSGEAELKQAQARYETAKLLLEDAGSAIQWDLYHRTKAPDVAAFHWGNTGPAGQKEKHVTNGVPIMSAYSMSTGFTATQGFGEHLTAVPLAIRHVQMHTHSGGVFVSYDSEYEVTTGHRMKLDDRAFFASSGSMGSDVKKYLEKMAPSGGEPSSGEALIEARKAMLDPSYELPLPPEPPHISPIHEGSESAQAPPIPKLPDQKIADAGYSITPEQPIMELGLTRGDTIEGLSEAKTRYVVIDNNVGDLFYAKVDPGNGQIMPNKVFPLSSGGSFKKLDLHYDIPSAVPVKKTSDFTPWGAGDYAAHVEDKGASKKMSAFNEGEKFLVNGEAWEVQTPGGNPLIKSMNSGKKAHINAGFKAPPLVAKEGYVPTQQLPLTPETPEAPKEWKSGDRVLVTSKIGAQFLGRVMDKTDDGFMVWTPSHPQGIHLTADLLTDPPPSPGIPKGEWEPGDKFAHENSAYTITNILKDGTVKAKPPGGKVESFPPDWFSGRVVYRPSTWAVGEKSPLGELDIGDVVQGGTGATLRPYVIEGKANGNIWLRNLETNEVSKVSGKKALKRLVPASAPQEQTAPGEIQHPKLSPDLVPTGVTKPLKDFKVGEGWQTVGYHSGGGPMMAQLVAIDADGSWHVSMGATSANKLSPADVSKLTTVLGVYAVPSEEKLAAKPELAGKFDQSKWIESEKAKLKELVPGDVFLSATGIAMQLKSTSPKGGATAVALHNGKLVKNISYEKDFTTLVEKADVPFDHSKLSVGDQLMPEQAKPGDMVMTEYGAGKWMVVEPDASGQVQAKKIYPTGMAAGYTVDLAPGEPLTYYGPYVAPTPKPTPPPPDVDSSKLEMHPSYESYLHPKSGKFKYDKLSVMAEGTVFTDKAGNAFKIVTKGGSPVISDGSQLWQANGDWRGKVDHDGKVAFTDPVDHPATPASPAAVTVGDLQKGDKFVIPEGYQGAGQEHEVVDATPKLMDGDYHVVLTKTKTPWGEDSTSYTSTTLAPSKITKATPPDPESAPKNLGVAEEKVPVSSLKQGDVFALYKSAGVQGKVMSVEPDGVYVAALSAGDVKGFKLAETDAVYLVSTGTPDDTPSEPLPILGYGWKTIGDIPAGTVLQTGKGQKFVVVSHDGDDSQLEALPGSDFHSTVGPSDAKVNSALKVVSVGGSPASGTPGKAGDEANSNPLVSAPKSVGEMPVGATFKNKTSGGTQIVSAAPFGETWTVTEHQPESGYVVLTGPSGKMLTVHKTSVIGSKLPDPAGITLPVEPLDLTLPPEVGGSVTADQLKPGDLVKSKNGSLITVTKIDDNGEVWGEWPVGHQFAGAPDMIAIEAVTFVGHGSPSLPKAKSAPSTSSNPLVPYLHPKSGKYKYEKLEALPLKTEFTDKAGNKYMLVGFQGDNAVFVDWPSGSKMFMAPKISRVKATKLGDALQEAALVMSSTGRFVRRSL